jgi:hypothetical protein
VIDYEKLGTLYLGRHYDPARGEPAELPVLYSSRDLTTHAVCVGMTGSGKTGLCISLLEEAAIDGIPALCIDPKGDLGNLMLTFPNLAPEDFEPWIDPAEADRKGRTVAEHARAVATRWREGLADWGQDGARIARLKDTVDVTIYTPGSNAGRPLRVLESFAPPGDGADADAERDQIMASVSGLLTLLGIDPDPVASKEHIFLSSLLSHAWSKGETLELADLVHAIANPPFSRVGVMDLESFYPEGERQKLAMRVNGLLASPGFAAWLEGDPLNVQRLLWTESGKPRIAILSIAHLSEAERMFFVSTLLSRVVSWMRRQSGTSSLRALLYMDEVFGFLPPVSEPPSKRAMLTLLKQARAYGVGVVLATQNPVDIDYKALSNCGTWFLGRLQTERDVGRVLDGLAGAAAAAGESMDTTEVERLLAGLKSRVFLLKNAHDPGHVLFHTRWAMSYLRGPLTRSEIRRLCPPKPFAEAPAEPHAVDQAGARAPAAQAPSDEARPVVPPGIDEAFVDGGPGRYEPHVVADVTYHHVNAAHGLDAWVRRIAVMRLTADDPKAAIELAEEDSLALVSDPPDGATYVAPPSKSVGKSRFRSYGKQIRSHLYQACARSVWRADALKLRSRPEESKAEFAARVQLAAREKRDEAVEKLRARFETKLRKLEDRVSRAEAKLDRERSQYENQKLQTGISMGATVLGAIFGRGGLGRATTTARGAGRAARERQDVLRAEAELEDLRRDQRELEIESEEEVRAFESEWAENIPEVREILVRPRKSDIDVGPLKLVWMRR